MQNFFMGKSSKNVANGNAAASSEMEDGNTSYDYVWDDNPSSPLLSPGKVNQTGRVQRLNHFADWLFPVRVAVALTSHFSA